MACWWTDLSTSVGQSVQKFGRAWNPMLNTYAPSYRQPAATFGAGMPRGNSRNRGMAYRPPVRKPFSNAHTYRSPLVTSEQFGRAEILRGMRWF